MMVNFMKLLRPRAVKIGSVKRGVILLVGLLLAGQAHASCRLSVNQPLVDHGLLRSDGQSANHAVSVGKRTVRLNVVCSQATVIALRFEGMPAEGQGFRFGQRGYFNLTLQHPLLDGKPVELARLYNHAERDSTLRPGQSLVALVGGLPATGRTFSAQVQVETWLSSAAMAVRDKTTLEGNGRFEWVPGG